MMRNFVFFLLSTSICLQLFAQKQLVIFHTNNINGKLENCLCDEQPFGALEKITYIIKKERTKKTPLLFVDAGDFFSPFEGKRKNNLLLEALKIAKYDVQGVGDQEFAMGPGFFTEQVLKTKAPYICANLTIDGKSIVLGDKIITRNNVRIAITSVMGENSFKFYPEASILGIEVSNPEKALASWLTKTGKKADIHILLSHLGFDDDKKIAAKYPGIDLIISGHTQEVIKEPVKIGNTYLFEAGSDGYYLGKISLSFNKNKKIQSLNYQLIPMELKLPNDPEISQLATNYDFYYIETSLARLGTFPVLDEKYIVGDVSICAGCHQKEVESWKKTAHYQSINIIDEKKKSKVHKCVSCHVSGYGRIDGFVNLNLTKNLGSVNCTECHYTNKEHLKRKDKKSVAKITSSTCVRCHDKENDPDFNFEKSLKMVKCVRK